MSTVIAIIITITLMVSANAFYVAAEFAAVSSRKTRIAQMAGTGNRLALLILPILEDSQKLDRYVAASQIGISISSLVLGAFGQNTVAAVIAPILMEVGLGNLTETLALSISVTGVLICLSIFQVILGELVPKSITIQYPEKIALITIIPMKWSLTILRPLIWFFNGSANLVVKLIGAGADGEHIHLHSPEEIELLVSESHEGGLLDDEAQQMLRNAFRLRELTARQVMVPRMRMVAAPLESSVAELVELACQEGFSRIPLYQSTIDDITGFVHIKDLFRLHLQGQQSPLQILRKVVYVPESLPIADVWTTLNAQHQYIAIVFGEHGGTEGLVSLEDLIEEIFGELQDEFDEELPFISYDKTGRLYLRGDLLVTDINEYLELHLPEKQADTLGGLIFSKLGRLPVVGDEVTVGTPGTKIRVESMDSRSVAEVSLQLPPDLSRQEATMNRLGEWEVADYE